MNSAEHHLAAPRPTVDVRLVPAAATAWGTALVLTGQNSWVDVSSGWLTVVGFVLGMGSAGGLSALGLAWIASGGKPGKLVLPDASGGLHRLSGRMQAIAVRWRMVAAGALLCLMVSGAVTATALQQEVGVDRALSDLKESQSSGAGQESSPAQGTGTNGVHRVRMQVVDRPLAWSAASTGGSSGSDDSSSRTWGQDSGEASGGVVIAVQLENGQGATVFAGDSRWRSVRSGDMVEAVVTVPPSAARDLQLRTSGAPKTVGTVERGAFIGWLDQSKRRFLAGATTLGPEAVSLLPGMTYGDRAAFDPELEQAMKDTGLTHLTAVSGSNCALVMVLAGHLVLGFGARRRTCIVAGLAALGSFVLLVGPDASVVRAAVMGTVAAVGILAGRGGTSLAALSVAVCGLLVVDPAWGRDFGFALSVCATAGIIVTGRPLIRILTQHFPAVVATAIAIPVVAQLWCAAVLTLLTPAVPVFSVVANAVVAPVVPVVTVLGLLALLAFGQPWALGHFVGQGLLTVGDLPAGFVAVTARFFAGLPGAVVPWWQPPLGPVVMACMCLVLIVLVHRWDAAISRRHVSGRVDPSHPGPPVSEQQWRALTRTRRRWRWISWSITLSAVAVLVLGWLIKPAVPTDWMAVMCDVGQGDAMLLRSASGGETATVLIDSGPDPGALRRCLRTAQVDQLDLLVLTHDHADHVAGAAGLDQQVGIQQVWWSSGTGRPPQEITEWSVAVQQPAVGQVWEHNGLRLQVLGPSGDPAPSVDSSGENNASLAIRATIQGDRDQPGVAVFAAGDMEEDGATRLIRDHGHQAGGPLDVDVLKVSHHGARNGGTRIVDATTPSLALISVGENNDYGHPHPDITTHVAGIGAVMARTDHMGTVGLYINPDGTTLDVRPLP
ncbi:MULTISPECIES: ComEC/Rec2 family competence protein [Kocuria]|uniref:MBL fold metallo-hydrolase n=1 Tax=Kocuria subflava TaxID=1736139 RepID=A0A846THU7_9MICC|nr:ComEC/Rec2 family competence protein [Kocuria sp. CPCC 104605]NKE08738.1 MBL fold metallo-hydrolase [Kocuria subflava]